MKLKAVIIDDEKKLVKLLEMLLEENCNDDVEIIGTATSFIDGTDTINRLKPDLVFLDIEMPHGNGFQLLENVTYKDFEVVFVTAYNQYAIKAFKASAIDYLLKPVNEKELIESVKRAVEIKDGTNNVSKDKIEEIVNVFQPNKISKIPLSTVNKIEFVDIDDIIYIEAAGSYSTVYTTTTSITVSKKIKLLEETIEKDNFFRSHKSFLINLDHVKAYYKNDGGLIEMSNNTMIPVSRKSKDKFLNWMDKILKV